MHAAKAPSSSLHSSAAASFAEKEKLASFVALGLVGFRAIVATGAAVSNVQV